jgi:hypothetical protein
MLEQRYHERAGGKMLFKKSRRRDVAIWPWTPLFTVLRHMLVFFSQTKPHRASILY